MMINKIKIRPNSKFYVNVDLDTPYYYDQLKCIVDVLVEATGEWVGSFTVAFEVDQSPCVDDHTLLVVVSDITLIPYDLYEGEPLAERTRVIPAKDAPRWLWDDLLVAISNRRDTPDDEDY